MSFSDIHAQAFFSTQEGETGEPDLHWDTNTYTHSPEIGSRVGRFSTPFFFFLKYLIGHQTWRSVPEGLRSTLLWKPASVTTAAAPHPDHHMGSAGGCHTYRSLDTAEQQVRKDHCPHTSLLHSLTSYVTCPPPRRDSLLCTQLKRTYSAELQLPSHFCLVVKVFSELNL